MEQFIQRHSILLKQLGSRASSVAIWLGILPFFLLCWYAHPSADDFLQGTDVKKHGHWGYLHYMYFHWTGRYTAMLGWSFLNPVSYGHVKAYYGLACFLMIVLLLAAIVLLLRVLLKGSGYTTWQCWQAGAAGLLLVTYFLPSIAEYFYWLTGGAFNYLLPGILLLLALATLALHAAKARPRFYLRVTALLLFLVVGFNETIAVPVLLTVWAIVLLESWQQRRLVAAEVALAVSIGCLVAFLAPGNFVRMGDNHPQGIIVSVYSTLKLTAYFLVNWLGNGVLVVVTLLLVPTFARLAQLSGLPLNHLAKASRHPILTTLLVLAFLTAGIFPCFWASNISLPNRASSLLYLCFIVTWLLAAYHWIWYGVNQKGIDVSAFKLPSFVRWSLLAWLPLTFLTDYNNHLLNPNNRLSTNNSLLAYRELRHGTAARYDAQLMARYHYLQTSTLSRPQVAALQDPPITLLFGDITQDTTDWANLAYAEFFGKKTIVIKASDTK